jgi:hypothetical protein
MMNDPLRDEILNNAEYEFERMSWDEASDKIINVYKAHTEGAPA